MGFYGGRPGADFKINKIYTQEEIEAIKNDRDAIDKIKNDIGYGEYVLFERDPFEENGRGLYVIYTRVFENNSLVLKKVSINLDNIILSGYDGASNYKGVYK